MVETSSRSSAYRYLWRTIAAIAAALAVLAVAYFALMETPQGRALVVERLLAAASASVGSEITVDSVAGDWPGDISLTGVSVGDDEGPWLTIDRLRLLWRPSALLGGRVDVTALEAGTATLLRLPTGAGAGSSAPMTALDLADLLDAARVEQARVRVFKFAPAVLGAPADFSVTAALTQDAVGADLRLDVQRLDGPGTLTTSFRRESGALRGRLEAGVANVTVGGEMSAVLGGDAVTGTLRLSCTSTCIRWSSGKLDRANATVDLSGTFAKPLASAAFQVEDLELGMRRLAHLDGRLVLASDENPAAAFSFSGAGSFSGMALLPELSPVLADDGQWSITGLKGAQGLALKEARIEAGDASLALSGVLQDDQLQPAAATATLRGAGRLLGLSEDTSSATVTVSLPRLTMAGEGSGVVEISSIVPPGRSAGTALPPVQVRGVLTSTATGIRIFDLASRTKGVSVSGQSAWTRDQSMIDHASTRLRVDLAEKYLGDGQPAPVTFSLEVEGALADLRGDFRAHAARIGTGASELSDADLRVSATRRGERIAAQVRGAATRDDTALALTADVVMPDPNRVEFSSIRFDGAAGTLAGELALDTRGGTLAGTITAAYGNIAEFASLLGVQASGGIDAALIFSAPDGAQRIDVSATGRNLASNPVSADTLAISGVMTGGWSAPMFKAELKTGAGQLVGRPMQTLAIAVAGSTDEFAIGANAHAPGGSDPMFGMDARVVRAQGASVTVTRLTMHDGGFDARLVDPMTVNITADAIDVPAIRATVAGGTVTGRVGLDWAGDTIEASARFARISTAVLGMSRAGTGSGTVDGSLKLTGPLREVQIDAVLTSRLELVADAASAVDVALEARGGDGRLRVKASASGFSPEPAVVNADVPFVLDLTAPRIAMDMSAPISARADWNGELAPLWDLLPTEQHILSGLLDADVSVSGTLETPNVAGGLRLEGGSYQFLPGGTVLRNLDIGITGAQGSGFAVTLSGADAGAGVVTAKGQVVRNTAGDWSADIAADLRQMRLVTRDDVGAAVSGTLSYVGPAASGTLKGQLRVTRGAIHLDSTGVPDVPLLRSWEAAKAETADAPPPPSPIAFDVALVIDDLLEVEGRGLDFRWRGRLQVSGDMTRPEIEGTVTLERGTFSFIGQTFDLQSGTVVFTGGGEVDPDLSVTATREASDITATVRISGRASVPSIALSSTPVMPQDEILARLLFNRNAGELGPLETLQLASAAADLSGVARGGISGMVRRTFGLDTFSFGGRGGDAVVVGQQISRNIYVGVEQSVSSASRTFVVNWRLSRYFSLRSSASDQTGADIGLFWRKDY